MSIKLGQDNFRDIFSKVSYAFTKIIYSTSTRCSTNKNKSK